MGAGQQKLGVAGLREDQITRRANNEINEIYYFLLCGACLYHDGLRTRIKHFRNGGNPYTKKGI